ncbi:unnamed protein product [Phyllotreta striolata]|uniref:Uncharacterized protein n=1 Tax=Phyllotreta striolata TaxID=444603 RepID=A0A9P0GRU8_PHYSR|nr:unnamed protein product [Phyllotreta striolata]
MDEMRTTLIVLLAVVCSVTSILHEPLTNYHQETIYPSTKTYLTSAGFKTSYTLAGPEILHSSLYDVPRVVRGPPQYPLFTPNSFDQRPETVGQIEEYRKALAEEAEERNKENEISTNFGKFGILPIHNEATRSYVDFEGDAVKYKYRV